MEVVDTSRVELGLDEVSIGDVVDLEGELELTGEATLLVG